MPEPVRRMRWSVENRLEFIEFRLFWEGTLNRSDIVDYFGVSVPQASTDLARYQELAPRNIEYDRSAKRYFATATFKPVFKQPDAERYLNQLRSIGNRVLEPHETWLTSIPSFEAMPVPRRRVDPLILRSLLTAIRDQRSIRIHYQSLTRPEPIWRWITPHALGSDGLRWHIRAFCHIDRTFKDFLLPRFLETKEDGPPAVDPSADGPWNEFAAVELVPHPQLSKAQRRVVALDYGMDGESITISMRLALLYYFLKRLNLDGDAERRAPKEQHVVLGNKAEVRAALKRAQEQTPLAA
jgi:predicted DNA-binding transcriptional regulator YafY